MSLLLRMYPGDSWTLLIANVLEQATVVMIAAELLARLGSRWNAAWRHSIYSVALVCVLASPLLSWAMQAGGITLVRLRPPERSAPTIELASVPTTHVAPLYSTGSARGIDSPTQPHAVREEYVVSARKEGPRPELASTASLPDVRRAIGGGLMGIWLLGTILLLARWCRGLQVVARLRREARLLDSVAIADELDEVRRGLGVGRLPPVATSDRLDRPIMVGLIRPLVIMPEQVLRTLGVPRLTDILIHECAHAVCRHQAINFLQRVAAILFWPHPLIHLLNRALARTREEICDNYVLRRRDAPRYARTLLDLSELLVGASPKPTMLGLFHCRWKLEDRIADLLDRRRRISLFAAEGGHVATLQMGGVGYGG